MMPPKNAGQHEPQAPNSPEISSAKTFNNSPIMCGRYTLTRSIPDLELLFDAVPSHLQPFEASRNISPGQTVPVVAQGREGTPVITSFRWGIKAPWAEKSRSARLLINARAETIRQKPTFASSFQRYRCVVPADGFYEWKARQGERRKTPWLIDRSDGKILAMAGIFVRHKPENGPEEFTCAIITTEANKTMAPIHDRMPVILELDQAKEWIRRDSDPQKLYTWLQPLADGITSLHEGVDPAGVP